MMNVQGFDPDCYHKTLPILCYKIDSNSNII